MNKLVFLGTGAGDAGMIRQEICTSSLYFELDGLNFVLDPGPGTLVNAKKNKINLFELDGVIVTHPHPDHYTDANALIDSLRNKDSFLIAGKRCLIESDYYYPCINKFQQTIPKKTGILEPGVKIKIKNLTFEGVKNNHLDCGLGLKIIGSEKIGYVGDGSISGLEGYYKDMDILIFNVLLPYGKDAIKGIHTSVNEVIEFLKLTKPKQAIIQHFSQEMIKANIDKQAKIIQDKTGIKTISAKDGMGIKL